MTDIKKSTLITIVSLGVVVIVLWILSVNLSSGEKPNNLPYRTWENEAEMIKVLGADYQYPTYLPTDMPSEKVQYTSWYIDQSNKKEAIENFEGYNLFYKLQYNAASTLAKEWLEEVLIKCERSDRAVSNRQYTTIEDIRKDPANMNYIYIKDEEEVKADSLSYYLSAYYTQESSNLLTVEAYYENNGLQYSITFSFIRREKQTDEPLDKKYANYEEDTVQFAKDEINKTLQSLASDIK